MAKRPKRMILVDLSFNASSRFILLRTHLFCPLSWISSITFFTCFSTLPSGRLRWYAMSTSFIQGPRNTQIDNLHAQLIILIIGNIERRIPMTVEDIMMRKDSWLFLPSSVILKHLTIYINSRSFNWTGSNLFRGFKPPSSSQVPICISLTALRICFSSRRTAAICDFNILFSSMVFFLASCIAFISSKPSVAWIASPSVFTKDPYAVCRPRWWAKDFERCQGEGCWFLWHINMSIHHAIHKNKYAGIMCGRSII